MICEKADSKLKRNQANAIRQVAKILWREECSTDRQISLKDRSAKVEIKADLFGIESLFAQSVAAGTQTVADVVMNQSRFHSVKIDQAYGLSDSSSED